METEKTLVAQNKDHLLNFAFDIFSQLYSFCGHKLRVLQSI